MADKLTSGQVRFCRDKVQTLMWEKGRKEKLFQDKINKLYAEHNEEMYRLEDQIQRLQDQIKFLIDESPYPPQSHGGVGR